MIKAGITGGAHPAAGELIRILINHPDVELQWVAAPEVSGEMVSAMHKGLLGETYMRFSDEVNIEDIDVLFLCPSEPGENKAFLEANEIPERIKIVDLSADYRLTDPEQHTWVYALPELNRKPLVRGATKAAIPGELAHAVLLGLLPMAKNLMLNNDIHISVTTATDEAAAGQPLAYLDHEEIDEMKFALRQLQSSFNSDIYMLVSAAGWNRGTVATMYLETGVSIDELRNLYDEFYEDHNFTFLTDQLPDLREVTNTNKCVIHLEKVGKRVAITSMIDDKLKGTAGTAVHAMNLLFGLQERVGLMLKSV